MNSVRARIAGLTLLAATSLAVGCSERIEAGAACPVLCPLENEVVRDTVIEAVALDTTLRGYPFPGEAGFVLVALRPAPDSLDLRAVIRFDSLPNRFFPTGAADSADITRVDSSFLRLRVDTTGIRLSGPVTLEAYDVDTAASVDTAGSVLASLFRPDRLLGRAELSATTRTGDSLRIALSNAVVASKAAGTRRLRIGLRLTGAGAAQLRIRSAQGGLATVGPRLAFDPSTDTTYTPIVLDPASATPDNADVAAGLQDFTFVARAARPADARDLLVGGVPAGRSLLRFALPARLSDSTTIVRATLRLVQRPARGFDAADTVSLIPDVVVANESVTDLRRVLDLLGSGTAFGLDSIRIAPADSGVRDVPLVNVVRSWRGLPPGIQRAIVLRSALEGAQAGELRFFSVEAAPGLRPRLQLSYIPRTNFGIP